MMHTTLMGALALLYLQTRFGMLDSFPGGTF